MLPPKILPTTGFPTWRRANVGCKLSSLNGNALSDAPLMMEIEPGVFVQENLQGWIMDLYVCGQGETQDVARSRLDANLEKLTAFFRNESVHCL